MSGFGVGPWASSPLAGTSTHVGFDDFRRDILNGLVASGSAPDIAAWNAFIAGQPDSVVARTSGGVVTITFVADTTGFDIAAQITIEDTIPAAAVAGAAPIVASPTFTIDPLVPATTAPRVLVVGQAVARGAYY
jgi:hypothetical protein